VAKLQRGKLATSQGSDIIFMGRAAKIDPQIATGVGKRIEIGNPNATRENSVASRHCRSVKSQPTAKAALPRAVFDVFAVTEDRVDPGLPDGERFHFELDGGRPGAR
jgi:hypothetical protein